MVMEKKQFSQPKMGFLKLCQAFLNWQVPQSRAGGTGCVGDKICLREDSW